MVEPFLLRNTHLSPLNFYCLAQTRGIGKVKSTDSSYHPPHLALTNILQKLLKGEITSYPGSRIRGGECDSNKGPAECLGPAATPEPLVRAFFGKGEQIKRPQLGWWKGAWLMSSGGPGTPQSKQDFPRVPDCKKRGDLWPFY